MTQFPLFKIGSLALAAVIIGAGVMLMATSDLSKIHKDIAADYENVDHIKPEAFTKLPPDNVVIFDVREPEEFAVSHLPGAIQVDPGLSEAKFQELYGAMLENKVAVFYCSVGRRSSHLAERVSGTVEAQTSQAPVNLAGGLFQWSNEDRALMAPDGSSTNAIHPYNAYWGRLIKDRSAVQYTPIPSQPHTQRDENDHS